MQVDALVGLVTRILDESSINTWSIYPAVYKGTDKPILCVTIQSICRPNNAGHVVLTDSFAIEPSWSESDVRTAIAAQLYEFREMAKLNTIVLYPPSRETNRKSWDQFKEPE